MKNYPPGYRTTTGFWTTQSILDMDDLDSCVTIYDENDNAYARIIRYEDAKVLAVERFRKNIPAHVFRHLAGRAIFALDPFVDGTPIEKAVKIPRELMPFVKDRVETRERKKEAAARKAERDAMRARGELPPLKPRKPKAKKKIKAKRAG
jgi:hypothetical protein